MSEIENVVFLKSDHDLIEAFKEIRNLHKTCIMGDGFFRKIKAEIEAAGLEKHHSMQLTETLICEELARRFVISKTGEFV